MVAILNIIDGIAAISKSAFFTNNARFVFSDLRTWGWIVLALGALQVLAAFGGGAGNPLRAWTGIVIVSLNAIAQLLFIPAYPFWSLSIFALDVLVLYGLAAHGGRPALERLSSPHGGGPAAAFAPAGRRRACTPLSAGVVSVRREWDGGADR